MKSRFETAFQGELVGKGEQDAKNTRYRWK